MRTLIIALGLVAFGAIQSCKTTKTVKEEVAVEEVVTEVVSERYLGTVKIDGSCGVVIHVIQGDVMRYFSPTNLEEKYAKEGLKIRFNSVSSGKKLPGECSIYEITEVSEVSAVR